MTIMSSRGSRRSPDKASKNSCWPLPATPAMPTTSPPCTVRIDVRQAPWRTGCRSGSDSFLSAQARPSSPHPAARAARCRPPRADHQARQALGALRLRIGGGDQLAAAQDRRAAGQRQHLREAVRDVEDGDALRGQPPQRDEEQVRLLRRQHRGRLVHDDEPRLLQQAADDLHALPLADRKVGDRRRRDRAAGRIRARRVRIVSASSRRPRGGSASAMFSATLSASNSEKCWNTMPMPRRRASAGLAIVDRPALPEDAPLVRLQRAVEHLDQRRFAGAVLAEQRMDLAGADFEADVVAGRQLSRSAW